MIYYMYIQRDAVCLILFSCSPVPIWEEFDFDVDDLRRVSNASTTRRETFVLFPCIGGKSCILTVSVDVGSAHNILLA
jgi:hypothetical protein